MATDRKERKNRKEQKNRNLLTPERIADLNKYLTARQEKWLATIPVSLKDALQSILFCCTTGSNPFITTIRRGTDDTVIHLQLDPKSQQVKYVYPDIYGPYQGLTIQAVTACFAKFVPTPIIVDLSNPEEVSTYPITPPGQELLEQFKAKGAKITPGGILTFPPQASSALRPPIALDDTQSLPPPPETYGHLLKTLQSPASASSAPSLPSGGDTKSLSPKSTTSSDDCLPFDNFPLWMEQLKLLTASSTSSSSSSGPSISMPSLLPSSAPPNSSPAGSTHTFFRDLPASAVDTSSGGKPKASTEAKLLLPWDEKTSIEQKLIRLADLTITTSDTDSEVHSFENTKGFQLQAIAAVESWLHYQGIPNEVAQQIVFILQYRKHPHTSDTCLHDSVIYFVGVQVKAPNDYKNDYKIAFEAISYNDRIKAARGAGADGWVNKKSEIIYEGIRGWPSLVTQGHQETGDFYLYYPQMSKRAIEIHNALSAKKILIIDPSPALFRLVTGRVQKPYVPTAAPLDIPPLQIAAYQQQIGEWFTERDIGDEKKNNFCFMIHRVPRSSVGRSLPGVYVKLIFPQGLELSQFWTYLVCNNGNRLLFERTPDGIIIERSTREHIVNPRGKIIVVRDGNLDSFILEDMSDSQQELITAMGCEVTKSGAILSPTQKKKLTHLEQLQESAIDVIKRLDLKAMPKIIAELAVVVDRTAAHSMIRTLITAAVKKLFGNNSHSNSVELFAMIQALMALPNLGINRRSEEGTTLLFDLIYCALPDNLWLLKVIKSALDNGAEISGIVLLVEDREMSLLEYLRKIANPMIPDPRYSTFQQISLRNVVRILEAAERRETKRTTTEEPQSTTTMSSSSGPPSSSYAPGR